MHYASFVSKLSNYIPEKKRTKKQKPNQNPTPPKKKNIKALQFKVSEIKRTNDKNGVPVCIVSRFLTQNEMGKSTPILNTYRMYICI